MKNAVRLRGCLSLIVLIGSFAIAGLPAAQPQGPAETGHDVRAPRRGPVRIEGRAVADNGGAFNALGATLFWGAWGYKFDRARLERNLSTLAAAGVDYVRVLGSVGGETWEDREVNPGWNDYDSIIAGLTDLAYDRYGLRVQWTIFGGAPFTTGSRVRESLVDRFARLAEGREQKIFAFEIANEAWSTGFKGPDGITELRSLGKRLSNRTAVLVALSAPQGGAACATYAGAGVDVMTIHYPRSFGSEGPLRPLQRPWSFPSAYHRECPGQLPPVVFNNEPIGPESSVQSDDNPERIGAAYVMTFVAGNAAYVLHTGPGIRGGGKADLARQPKRHANFHELPSFQSVASSLKAAKQYLPAGLANWQRRSARDRRAPIYGSDQLYSAVEGNNFVVLVLGDGSSHLRARVDASVDVRQISTGKSLERVRVAAGERFTPAAPAPVVLIGRAVSQ